MKQIIEAQLHQKPLSKEDLSNKLESLYKKKKSLIKRSL